MWHESRNSFCGMEAAFRIRADFCGMKAKFWFCGIRAKILFLGMKARFCGKKPDFLDGMKAEFWWHESQNFVCGVEAGFWHESRFLWRESQGLVLRHESQKFFSFHESQIFGIKVGFFGF